MHRSGILVLTKHVSSLCQGNTVKHIVAGIKEMISSTLYVHLENTSYNHIEEHSDVFGYLSSKSLEHGAMQVQDQDCSNRFSSDVFAFLWQFYSEAAHQCHGLDVNILLHNIGTGKDAIHNLKKPVQCIVVDISPHLLQSDDSHKILQNFVKSHYNVGSAQNSTLSVSGIPSIEQLVARPAEEQSGIDSKGSVVVGGTFDHVHTGHKLLLSEAALLTDKRLLVGVTDGEMLQRKTLYELIKPWSVRKKGLEEFLCDISNFTVDNTSTPRRKADAKVLEIVRIVDPIGPASTDADLQCIAVSKETERGGRIVNEARLKNGLNALHVHVITGGVLGSEEDFAKPTHESKVSSSTLRFEQLGKLLRVPGPRSLSSDLPDNVYVIGLTGGIASGKSSIAERLRKLGAHIIDCDKLGHKAYEPSTATFRKVVERFGDDIVSATGAIDRKVLAGKVFSGAAAGRSSQLDDLNNLVWPEIERLARIQIANVAAERRSPATSRHVCVLDAAVLLEAGWDQFTDEVWAAIVPPAEAVKRVMERDSRTQKEAEKRLLSQLSNSERVKRSHVVLSSLWEYEVTQSQVEKAWSLLQERLFPEGSYSDDAKL